MKKLRYPKEDEIKIKRGWLNRLPFYGVSVDSQLQIGRHKHIQKQIDERGLIGADAWISYDIDMELKEKIDSMLIDTCAWDKGASFHPEDQFHILMQLKFGDLCEEEFILVIEEYFLIEWTKEWTVKIRSGMKYHEFLQLLQNQQQSGCPSQKLETD